MTTTAPDTDLARIRAVISDVAAGVTAKDADRCAAWFTPDARSVTADGARAVGRDAIRAAHQAAFAGSLATTVAHFEVVDTLFLGPDVAVVTAGAYAGGTGPRTDLDRPGTVITHVMVRDGETWAIAARQFTRVSAG
jgi:uncharacterized protein (TIGR02246 family)